ncbi:hypothetical protein AM1_0628 [Acaryochloris marina MBIC11017]|uniref:Uncharacterized protein n=2 Tax=Acaryochloris marina TaxID=155978 RepID=B0CD86_ACAM1|nr:hypothetical protein AM1_0628 [Acaryochloris marina MBIC11017]BDM80550.1 hypothetical protein AM10699_34180 [Acaryochloris marina MBIC10699]
MKMRRSFWTDRPRHVSKQEYNRYSFMVFGTVVTGGLGAMLLISSVLGMTTWQGNELAELPEMSISEALNHKGKGASPFKISGYLLASDPISMPDEPELKVLKGELQISAKFRDSGETTHEMLFEWQEQVDGVMLSQANRLQTSTQAISVDVDLAQLPLRTDRRARARLQYDGSSRTSRPIAIEYQDQTFPLADLPTTRTVTPKVLRQYFPSGEKVTLIASIESGQTSKLVAPLGQELKILRGSESDIRKTGATARLMFGLTSFVLLGVSYGLGTKAARLRHSFVVRSNQP